MNDLTPTRSLLIALGDDEFLFAGIGLTITFASTEGGQQAGLPEAEVARVGLEGVPHGQAAFTCSCCW